MKPFALNVVLVRTIYDTNIGATSRAMGNMGAKRLILIDPKCELTYAAQQAAASGQEALQSRTVYSSWEQFYQKEPEGIRIAFTSKNGEIRQVRDYQDVLSWIQNQSPIMLEASLDTVPIYLIFGPEDWGLSNHDLDLTHFNVCLPTFGVNVSLNLAQAVLLALFQLRLAWGGERTALEGKATPRKDIDEPQIPFPDATLKAWLHEMGMTTEDRPMNAHHVLKQMLLHNVPSQKEMHILNLVLQQGLRKLREYNQLRKEMGLPHVGLEEEN